MQQKTRHEPVTFEWGTIQKSTTIDHVDMRTSKGLMVSVNLDRPVEFLAEEEVQVQLKMVESPRPKFAKYNAFGVGWLMCGIVVPMIEIQFTIWTKNRKQKVKYRYGRIGGAA